MENQFYSCTGGLKNFFSNYSELIAYVFDWADSVPDDLPLFSDFLHYLNAHWREFLEPVFNSNKYFFNVNRAYGAFLQEIYCESETKH